MLRFPSTVALTAALFAACAPRTTVPPATASPVAHVGDTVEIMVAATTDVHGRIRAWDYNRNREEPERGLSRLATVVDSLRTAHPGRLVLVDAGDLFQGNALATVAAQVRPEAPHPVIAAMSVMRYDAAAVGNHEFNYGLPLFDRAVASASFPFLAANTFRPDGSRYYRAWHIVERGGVRVGIVGGTTPGSLVWDRENLRGRMHIRALVPEVRRAVEEVRGEGADVVVVVLHSGLGGRSSYDEAASGLPAENASAAVALEVPGIDLVVFGHSHSEVIDTVIGGTTLVQPRQWATTLSLSRLRVVRDGTRWRVAEVRGASIPARGQPEHRAVLAATAESHAATVAWVNDSIGFTSVTWRADSSRVRDTPLIDFILEVQRRTAGTDLASTAAFSLDATLDSGTITVARMTQLYPYENTLVGIRISGAQLRAYLEQSARYFGQFGTSEPAVNREVPGFNYDMVAGASYTVDVGRPVGSRITRLEVRGRPVRDGDSFTLALNNYRQGGGGGFDMLTGAEVVYDRQESLRDLLIAEVRRRGTLDPADYFDRNWELAPAPAIAEAYRAMRGAALR